MIKIAQARRAYLFQITREKSFDYLLIIYKWQFVSRCSISRDKWRQRFIYENKAVSFIYEKQFLITVELKNLTTRQRKNPLASCSDAPFLPNVFRVVEKLFNPAQVAWTKIPRNEPKI